MGFSFLHTADWHIGKSFGSFSAEQQPLLRQARLDTIARIGDVARARNVRHVVVCGDIFDGPGLADRVISQALAAMEAQVAVVWYLLPGNHDPARAGGIWQRVAGLGVPANVRLLLQPQPMEIEPGVLLLPAPLNSKTIAHDPTGWMDSATNPDGVIRIGVAHGSTQGFGGAGEASVGISPTRRVSARLDYLALGDWHGAKEITAGVWYSGTPEPDQFPDNEPGHALHVDIAGPGMAPTVTRIATAKYTWTRRTFAVRGPADLTPVEEWVTRLGVASATHLLEVNIDGIVVLVDDTAIRARLGQLDTKLFHLRQNLDGLRLDAGDEDIETIGDVELKAVAIKLIAMRAAAGQQSTQTIEDALRRLFQFTQRTEGAR